MIFPMAWSLPIGFDVPKIDNYSHRARRAKKEIALSIVPQLMSRVALRRFSETVARRPHTFRTTRSPIADCCLVK